MRRSTIIVAAIAAFALPTLAAEAQSIAVPKATVKLVDLGGGPQLGTVWGDSSKGPHGSLLYLPAGFTSPEHTHTGTYEAVVISGTVTNNEAGAAEIPLEAGSYYRQSGQTKHVTKCISQVRCALYITQTTGFDFLTK
jgi:anti-sigma factor ChrR (cupin superfamily)